MAKKSRRARRKRAPRRLSEAQLIQPSGQEAAKVTEAPAVEPVQAPVQQPVATDFGEEYRYVVKDLQRIGILAAAMLGALVVLSIIL